MLFRRKDAEVLVSGAGPVGMFSALCLAEKGLEFRVVDKDVRPASHSYALALHPRSIEMLETFGLSAEDEASGARVETIAFYDEQRWKAAVRLSDLPGAHPYLLVLRQSRIEQLLEKLLKDARQKVEWTRRLSAVEMDDEGVRVTVDHLDKVSSGYAVAVPEWQVVHRKTMHPSFVIGADGADSMVRRAFGVDWRDTGPAAVFAVFEFDTDFPLGSEVRVVLGEKTTSVVWPLPDGKVRWSFELTEIDREREVAREKSRYPVQTETEHDAHLDHAALRRMLGERAPWFDATPGEISWSTLVRFERRIAKRFAGARFALCGDAAHLTGPVGVQSMNLGFAEAKDVVERVSRVLRDGADPDLIAEYDRRWRREWEFLLGVEGELAPGARTDAWVAWNRYRIRACLPGWGDAYRLLAEQLGLEVRKETPAQIS
jgi:2-polyprenyl-6-methoxyphenol hydroxylase-like FAD-dependent oxidoreductase